MKDKRDYLMQVGLKQLGFDPGPLDGDEGPMTRAAFAKWEASLGGNTVGESLGATIVNIAKTQIGIRESSRNRGAGIEKYWSATTYPSGYTNREPYCAAFVCWVLKEALRVSGKTGKVSPLTSPVAYDSEKWARSQSNVSIFSPGNGTPKPGAIFTLSAASHVGLIESVGRSTVTTIEGNTDGSGSREGDGVYRRTRSISSLRRIMQVNV